ncbi:MULTISPECIES: hypothetical protein [Enterobacter]|uniref:hypothetical protein n=1 Tax=Enterobacter TaxID=547 RepID=UPI0032AFF9FF
MEPFKVSPHLSALLDSYPDVQLIVDAAKKGGETSRAAIARLWLSEGIPFAFKNAPALYEVIRAWLGVRLDVNPKEIHLSGSARLGQSLAPHKIGTAFGQHSDLDLFVVSESLFEKVRNEFNKWSTQFEGGTIQPKNAKEKEYWEDNNIRGYKNLQRGFIDSKIIPNREAYPTVCNISNSMWLLKGRLDVTSNAPKIQSASVRCYKNWDSYVRQVMTNLE